MRSLSCPQPVPAVQSASSSSLVQRRAPASMQMASASANVLSLWHPPIPSTESAHGQLSLCLLQRLMRVSEQQRTSCSSEAATQPAGSAQLPTRPHSTKRRAVEGLALGLAEGGGGSGGGGSGWADGVVCTSLDHMRSL
eukprot:CAMPEP_0185304954 /NCGR_PEP_ID=MMETSP1363-20130426/15083_1 /TAXON_ID=38817 /ORGANISM="Gephyrocapsa oceanica, Strain RCC1303" /LENGTH=138 /DNA_ID=CAMNT_0027902165 /DNA_START=263 /DNA_END=675 /DNA_ORIENTATION=+